MNTKLFIIKCVGAKAGDIQRLRYERLIQQLIRDDVEFRVNKYVCFKTGHSEKIDYEVTVKDLPQMSPEEASKNYYGLYDLLYDGRWEDDDINKGLHNERPWFFKNYGERI